jgi:hypothetical protein
MEFGYIATKFLLAVIKICGTYETCNESNMEEGSKIETAYSLNFCCVVN